jgi:hypothetical protein
VVIGILLVSQTVAATGMPLPVLAAGQQKDFSQPYPCMNHPCGCMNAEQSWRSCCCLTMEEKLAWARENGVEPPEFVREFVGKTTTNPGNSENCQSGGCCHSKGQGSQNKAPSCCDSEVPKTTENEKPKAPSSQPRKMMVVLGMMALRCQGQGPQGQLSETPSTAASAPMTVVHTLELLEIVPILHIEPESIPHEPASPPPRGI